MPKKTTRKPIPAAPRKCVDCGAPIPPTQGGALRCIACRAKHKTELKREYKRRERLKRKLADANRPAIGEKGWTPPPRCKFCGKVVSKTRDYCPDCIKAGFDSVHQMFGTTNGWDRKPRSRVPVQDGVRGFIPTGTTPTTSCRTQFSVHNGTLRQR